MELYKKRE